MPKIGQNKPKIGQNKPKIGQDIRPILLQSCIKRPDFEN